MGRFGEIAEYVCPIIEVAVMAIKEEDLGVHLDRSAGPTEETHLLHPAIPIHIPTAYCGLDSHWGGSSEDPGCNLLPGEQS